MSRDIKQMPTPEIMSFLDAISVMDEEIDRAVRVAWQCFNDEGVSELERDEILETMKAEVVKIEPVRIKLVKEITRRFKHNFNLGKGPFEIKETISTLADKFPNLGLTKVEIDANKVKNEREDKMRETAKSNLKKT